MIAGRRVLAIVPARGGSKGIPLKNLRRFLGVPLVAKAGEIAAAVSIIDRAVVSTDHEEIARVAESAGLAAPFRRPTELSVDQIGDIDVIIHALLEMERLDDTHYDIIVMLQPTSPLRRPEHVVATIEKLVDEGWDAVWTLSQTDSKSHPFKQLTVTEEQVSYHDPRGAVIVARQQLQPVYYRNGVAYAFTRDSVLVQRTTKPVRTSAIVIEDSTVSIDTEWDLELAEYIAKRNLARS